jgi:hypothetical protein
MRWSCRPIPLPKYSATGACLCSISVIRRLACSLCPRVKPPRVSATASSADSGVLALRPVRAPTPHTYRWLELLKEIAPNLTRAIVLWDPAITAGIGQFAIIQSVATPAGVDLRPFNLSDAGEVERAITDFARTPNGGLIVTASALSTVRRDLIVALAARHKFG